MTKIPPFLRRQGVIDFKQPESPQVLSIDFDLPPERAIQFFKDKGLRTTFSYSDMWLNEHDKAFTVAKMMDVDLLATTRKAMDKAIADGQTFREFAENIVPRLQSAGWWGEKEVPDPVTGFLAKRQLGSPARLRTIFRSNMAASYAVGHWQQAQANQDLFPFLRYDAIEDDRTRDEHRIMDGTIRRVDDPFWRNYYPPNGYNCRCTAIAVSEADLIVNGWTVTGDDDINFGFEKWTNPRTGIDEMIPRHITPGWNHNPGLDQVEQLKDLLGEKVDALPWSDLRTAALRAQGIEPPTISEQLARISIAGAAAVSTTQVIGAREKLTRREQPIDVFHVEPGDLENIEIPEARIGKKYLDLYHVTDQDALESILKDGRFKASAENQYQGFDSAIQGLYGWATLERGLTELGRAIETSGVSDSWILAKVRVPISKFEKRLRPDEDHSLNPEDWRSSYQELQSVAIEGDVPSSYISSVTTAGADPWELQELIDELVDIIE